MSVKKCQVIFDRICVLAFCQNRECKTPESFDRLLPTRWTFITWRCRPVMWPGGHVQGSPDASNLIRWWNEAGGNWFRISACPFRQSGAIFQMDYSENWLEWEGRSDPTKMCKTWLTSELASEFRLQFGLLSLLSFYVSLSGFIQWKNEWYTSMKIPIIGIFIEMYHSLYRPVYLVLALRQRWMISVYIHSPASGIMEYWYFLMMLRKNQISSGFHSVKKAL